MTSKQTYFGLLAGMLLLIAGAVGLTYFGTGMLKNKGSELVKLKAEQETLEARKAALTKAERDIQKYAPLESISKSIVPQEKDQARTVRELVTIASESGVPISSIQFPSSALGQVKRKTAATSNANTPVARSNSSTTQLTPVPGTKGLYAMEITVQSDGSSPVPYERLLGFLERLENNRRTAHVIDISILPSAENRSLVTFSVTLNVYIKL